MNIEFFFEKEDNEDWVEYEKRLLHELDAGRASQVYKAIMDIIRNQMASLNAEVLTAKDEKSCWDARLQHRGVSELYRKIREKATELQRSTEAEYRQEAEEYQRLGDLSRKRSASVQRRLNNRQRTG